jgi:UbiD family decarboxylase
VRNVYCHSAGGGKYLAIMQVRKRLKADEGRQRQAALAAFTAFSELKHIILVDDDVDIFNTDDVLWAMTTRFQGDVSIVTIPGVRCHPLDPSATPEFNPLLRVVGQSCKTIFDCTVPVDMREVFERAPFADVDLKDYVGLEDLG